MVSMKRFHEDAVRVSAPHWSPLMLGNVLSEYQYDEELLRDIWKYIGLNSCFFMKKYHFSFNFLREMQSKISHHAWYYIIVCNDTYTDEEKKQLVKEFNLDYKYHGTNFWGTSFWV